MKTIISLSAQPSPSALAKKKADLSAKIEKQRAALDELTAQLKDVNKQLRAINGAKTRASTVEQTGGKAMLVVDGQLFAVADAKAAIALGKKTRKALYYIGQDGVKAKVLGFEPFRGGARNHRGGYGYQTAAAYTKFHSIIKAQKVGFLKKFENVGK